MATGHRTKPELGRRFAVSALLLVLCIGISALGLLAFVDKIPEEITDKHSDADAIVVLTGGSGRLTEGLNLLTENRAKKLFVSGVYRGVDVRRLLELSQRNPVELLCCIVLGYDANSTEGNALETKSWLESEGFTSLRLVTANYHIPRSVMEFQHVMPNIKLIPHAVFPDRFKRKNWWLWPGTLSLILSEYMKYLMSAVRQSAENIMKNLSEK